MKLFKTVFHRRRAKKNDKVTISRFPEGCEPCIGFCSLIGDRAYQQDYCLFTPPEEFKGAEGGDIVLVLCDGMGGMRGGELASRLCAETVYEGYRKAPPPEDPLSSLRELAEKANEEVSGLLDENNQPLRAGCTLLAAIIRGSRLYWLSIGDSRIYYAKAGELTLLTRDHNYLLILLQEAAAGRISNSEALTNPQRKALVSYIGMGQLQLVDTGVIDSLSYGDRLILCSDGVSDFLSTEDMAEIILHESTDSGEIAAALVDSALKSAERAHDNTSVICFEYRQKNILQEGKRDVIRIK